MTDNNSSMSSVALIGDATQVGRVQMHLIRHFGPASIQGTSGFQMDDSSGRILSLKMPQDTLNASLANVGTGDHRIKHSLQEVDHKGQSIMAMILT